MNMQRSGLLFRRRRERGLAAVEFAIILPVVLLLMLATAELGRAFYQYSTLVKAARNGVRYLSENAYTGSIEVVDLTSDKVASARNMTVYGQTTATATPVVATLAPEHVTVSSPDTDYVEVQIDFPYQPLFATLPGLTGGADIDMNITLSVSTTMRAI